MRQIKGVVVTSVTIMLLLCGCSLFLSKDGYASQDFSASSETLDEDNAKEMSSSSSIGLPTQQEIATLFGEALDAIDFSQVAGVGILETPDDRITQYILQLCGEFLFVTEGYTYPQAFEDSATSLYLISFTFQRLEKGWDGKRLSDFSQVENELGILQYQVDADVIAECISDFFAGIDALAMVERSECFDSKTQTVLMPMGIGGTISPFAIARAEPVGGNVLSIVICRYAEQIPQTTAQLETVSHETYRLEIQFSNEEDYRYLSLEKIYE